MARRSAGQRQAGQQQDAQGSNHAREPTLPPLWPLTILRRLWQMVPTLLGVVLLVFFLFKFFGGDPAEILGGLNATPAQIESIRSQLGLNKPWWTSCGIFVQQIGQLRLGPQLGHQRIGGAAFATRLPATLTMMLPILVLDTLLAIRSRCPWPTCAAASPTGWSWWSPPWRCRSASWSTSSSASTSSASSSAGFRCRAGATACGPTWRCTRRCRCCWRVLVGLAPQTRLYRSFFLDEIGQDYVRTARAKGVGENTILFKHVLRNAMIPILTNVGLALPGVFIGSFLIEVFFSIPGLGREVCWR